MTGWLVTLFASALIFMLLEWLMQEGSIKRTAQFVLGLVFMLVVISPLQMMR